MEWQASSWGKYFKSAAEWRGKAENKQDGWQTNQSLGLMKVHPISCLSLSRGGRLLVRTRASAAVSVHTFVALKWVYMCVLKSTDCMYVGFLIPFKHHPSLFSPLSHAQELFSESTCLTQRWVFPIEWVGVWWVKYVWPSYTYDREGGGPWVEK